MKTVSGFRQLLATLLEPCVRIAAWVFVATGRERYSAESVLRGRVLGGGHDWRIGRNVQLSGPSGRIRFGRRVEIFGNTLVDANGPGGYVAIGDDSHVDHYSVLYGQGGIEIGRACAFASGTIIYSQTNEDSLRDGTPVALQPATYAPVRIGEGCWFGAGVRVLPGLTVGEGVHVGAGAVLIRDVAPFSVVVGIPGRVVSTREVPPGSGRPDGSAIGRPS